MIVRPQTLPHQRVGWRLKGEEVRHPYLLSILGISIPYFWLDQIMLIVFAVYLGALPHRQDCVC
jgi:hypothetical protein